MLKMWLFQLLFLHLALLEITNAYSTRNVCTQGNHEECRNSDGEGACCAKAIVKSTVSGNTESVGNEYIRCYDYDAVLAAFDNYDVYTDTLSTGGNGNTYTLTCT